MATNIKPETMWMIYNPMFGFYYDVKGTRREAIAAHIKDKGYGWDFCKKRGDVCLKVVVSAQPRVQLTSGGRSKNKGRVVAATRN